MGRRLLAIWMLAAGLGLGGLQGCSTTAAPKPLASLKAGEAHGHTVFQAQCGACHYDRSSGSLHGPPLLGVFQKKALPSGAPANDERVVATVVHGRNMMPAMGGALTEQDLTDLLAYLHTL